MIGGSGVFDYALLYSLARKFNCKKYLEIGTYIGVSINILTDICDELHSITAEPGAPYSMKNWCKARNIPDYSERLTYSPKIVHHYGDSKTFNFNSIPQNIDLYFIDGDHSFNGVYCDTINVFKHRKPKSIVVWHDFKGGNREVAWAVKSALSPEEWKNVFCFDMNICGIYLEPEYQRDLKFNNVHWTEERQDLWCYDLEIKNIHTR
ncbi:MAG: class I SAM-dependent methyltransferase [Selenomonadaceae bacterium]|nr:class I SAM-dependent methyltransferase [Selenomonadaceae bacterium]